MKSIFLAALALASTPAFAAESAQAQAEVRTSVAIQALEAELAQAKAELEAAKAACKPPAARRTAAPKAQAATPTPVPAASPATDPKIEALEAKVKELETKVAELEARPAGDTVIVPAPVVNLTVEPAPVPVTVNPTVVEHRTTEVRTSGFRPLVYVGGDLSLGADTSVTAAIGGHLVGGVRPAWQIGNGEFAIDIEGIIAPQRGPIAGTGYGAALIPTYVWNNPWGDLGAGLGGRYECSVLVAEGCMANHTGADFRLTAAFGKVVGVRAYTDVKLGYLDVANQGDGMEFGVDVGATLFVGKRYAREVTVE